MFARYLQARRTLDPERLSFKTPVTAAHQERERRLSGIILRSVIAEADNLAAVERARAMAEAEGFVAVPEASLGRSP